MANSNTVFQKYALGAVLSDSNELDYDIILDSLNEGEIPEGVTVWYPFENEDTRNLVNLIEEYHDTFVVFADELAERRDKGEL